jgi:putative transposase
MEQNFFTGRETQAQGGYSRYILAWQLCTGMSAQDVKETIETAIQFTGFQDPSVLHRPRLLSDNGSCFVSKALKEFLEIEGIAHIISINLHLTST